MPIVSSSADRCLARAGSSAVSAVTARLESDLAFPRQADVRHLIEDEYFFLPASPEARATFWADLDEGAMAEMATAAATPAASMEDYRRELDLPPRGA